MADNTVLNAGAGGDTVASDDIGGVKHQRVKLSVGADGTAVDAIPVVDGLDSTATGIQAVGIVGQFDDVTTGAVTENQFAPVRISTRRALLVEGVASGTAQPISAASLPLPTSASTEASLSALAGDVGDTADAAATAGGTGTLHAKQRLITSQLDSIQTAVEVIDNFISGSKGLVTEDNSGAIKTAVELLDDAVIADDAAFTPATTKVLMAGFEFDDTAPDSVDEGDAGAARMSARREIYVQLRDAAGNERGLNIDAGGAVAITVATIPSHAVTNAGTFAVQGTAVGTVADDATTPGAPVMIGGTAKSPDATDPGNVSAEDDVVRFTTDLNRRQYVNTRHAWTWSYHENSSDALTDAAVQADPGDGYQLVITEIMFSTGAATACNIFFEEGSTTILGPWYLEAVAGRGVFWKGEKKVTASTALTVTTSAAIAHGLDVQGYIQKV